MAKEPVKTIYLNEDMEVLGTRGDVSGRAIGHLGRALGDIRKDQARIVVLGPSDAKKLFG